MKQLILHIGMPKAASTSLQRSFRRHEQLLASAGILYPRAGTDGAGHQTLSMALDGRSPIAERRRQLTALADEIRAFPGDTVVLSYEGWAKGNGAPFVATIFRDFAQREGLALTAAIIIRPQASFINSYYAFGVARFEEPRLFPVYFEDRLNLERLDFTHAFGPYEAMADVRQVVVPYGRGAGGNVIERFLTATGLASRLDPPTIAAIAGAGSANEASSAAVVEIARRIAGRGGRLALLRQQRPAIAALRALAVSEGLPAARFQGLTDAMCARAAERYLAPNEAFAQRYFGQSFDAVFPGHDRAGAPVTAIDPATLDPALSARFDNIAGRILAAHGESRGRAAARDLWRRALRKLRRIGRQV